MTIAGASTRAQLSTGDLYGGGMAEQARILKASLRGMFPLIEKQNVLLVLLNQVMAEIGGWRPGVTSSGGNAMQHDIHMRIKIDGGSTSYDGIYAVEKYSKLSLEKSKISPLIGDIPIIIDITKGGVIDREISLLDWIIKINPSVFKQASWWEVNPDMYARYKPYWDKFEGLSGKFRQSKLRELVKSDPNFVDFLQLIWLDLFSARYILQSEVCKDLHSQIETRLMVNLGLSYEEIHPQINEEGNSVTSQELEEISNILNTDNIEIGNTAVANVNLDTGEILDVTQIQD